MNFLNIWAGVILLCVLWVVVILAACKAAGDADRCIEAHAAERDRTKDWDWPE